MPTRRDWIATTATLLGFSGCLTPNDTSSNPPSSNDTDNETSRDTHNETRSNETTSGSRVSFSTEAVEDGELVEKYTCGGEGIQPSINIEDTPSETEYLALVLDDPDAPGGIFTHWTVWNVPADKDIPSRLPRKERVMGGARQGRNSDGKIGYFPPCPPKGDSPHRYRFTIYALPSKLNLEPGADRENLIDAINAVSKGRITGKYGRET